MIKPRKVYTVVDSRWWFVCFVVPGREMEFRRKLAKLAIMNFAPVTSERIKISGKIRRKMLFPGYVFIFGNDYVKFKKAKNIKSNYVYVINSNNEELYHMPHQIVFDLITKQALGVYDYGKIGEVSVGDVVDVFDQEEGGNLLLENVTIVSIKKEKATIFSGSVCWKIKLCFLRKVADKVPHSDLPEKGGRKE